jgi:hypothetical protein
LTFSELIEKPKLHAEVKRAAEHLGDGAGKIIVELDYVRGVAKTYNIHIVLPRRTA